MVQPYLKITVDHSLEVEKILMALADRRVLAGFPQQTDRRNDTPIGNAEIAYVQNYGAPELRIPARQFMEPAIADVKDKAVEEIKVMCQRALTVDDGLKEIDISLHRVGLLMQNSIRAKLSSDIPPPLAPATVAARIARRKSASWRAKRSAEIATNIADPTHPATAQAPGIGVFRTLVDTGKLRQAATYVIRNAKGSQTFFVGKT